jgi:hypothetical protein
MRLVSAVAPGVAPVALLPIMVEHLCAQGAGSVSQVAVLPLAQGQQPFPAVAVVLAVLV